MDFSSSMTLALAVEEIAGEIYRLLAEASAADTEQTAFFRRLEREEREHGKRLQLLGSMLLKDPKAFRGARLEIPGIESIVFELQTFKEAVQRGVIDVPGAVTRLVEVEERFAVTHAEVVARNADPGVKALFTMLASQDRAHAQLLKNRGVKAG
jgi:rubrerythrin